MMYYANKYGRTIKDPRQPLLINTPTAREMRAGQTGPIYLVPELCNMTGLSEEQRSNFQLMKALGTYTRQDPKKRCETLKKFSDRINTNQDIQAELTAWNLQFSRDLEQFRARILQPETILGAGSSKATYQLENADWGTCFRKWSSYSVQACTKEFITSLCKVSPSLGMIMNKPKMFPLTDNRPATYIQALDRVIEYNPSIVMVA